MSQFRQLPIRHLPIANSPAIRIMYIYSIFTLSLSLLVLAVRLAVDIHPALSAHHIAVLAKLFDRSPNFEPSEWHHHRGQSRPTSGHHARKRTHHGLQPRLHVRHRPRRPIKHRRSPNDRKHVGGLQKTLAIGTHTPHTPPTSHPPPTLVEFHTRTPATTLIDTKNNLNHRRHVHPLVQKSRRVFRVAVGGSR